jgi:26S proteasome regulatory subunit N1
LTVTFADPQALLASILSVLAMTYSDNGKRDTLYYRLISKSEEKAGDWGHEYVRHLAAEIGTEYSLLSEGKSTNNLEKDEKTLEQEKLEDEAGESRKFTAEQLQDAAKDCVDFFMKHNAEADAVDLLMEVESIKKLPEWTDDRTYARVCQYLVR